MIKRDFKEHYKKQSDEFRRVLVETGVVIKTACRATGVHVYMVDYINQRITLETKSDPESTVEKYQWDIGEPWMAAARVVMNGNVVLSDQVVGDERFPKGIPWRPRARSALCLPVISQNNTCLGILELYREEKDDPFTKSWIRDLRRPEECPRNPAIHWPRRRRQRRNHPMDEPSALRDDLSVANVILGWMGAYLSQTVLEDESPQSYDKLLEVHQEVMEEIFTSMRGNMSGDDAICRILAKIKCTMDADYICFCELDSGNKGTTPETFHVYDDGVNICGDRYITKKSSTFRFSEELGTLWSAMENRKPINLRHPCEDSCFAKITESYYGISTKSLLTYPVISQDIVRGVVAVMNKVNGPCFSSNDEIMCDILVQCLAAVSHYNIKQTSLHGMISKSRVMEKLLLLRLRPSDGKIRKTVQSSLQLRVPSDFFSFTWYPSGARPLEEFAVYMLKDILEPVLAFNDPLLVEFVLTVRNSYRPLSFHNFEHAVTVMHCAYVILKSNMDLFDQTEITAIMISTICHDCDHLGTTNSFLVTTNHALSKLYPTSQLEHHHYHLAAAFIQEIGLFKHLDSFEYRSVMDEIRHHIIATDLGVFFERRTFIMKLLKMKNFQLNNRKNRTLMKSILMTACDLSINCKPFPIAKKITYKLCEEFYLQGDKEKELGYCPAGLMDRDLQSRLPEEEVNFYSMIVLPCYSLLINVIPNTKPLYDGCLEAYRTWQLEMEEKNQPMWRVEDSYEINT